MRLVPVLGNPLKTPKYPQGFGPRPTWGGGFKPPKDPCKTLLTDLSRNSHSRKSLKLPKKVGSRPIQGKPLKPL